MDLIIKPSFMLLSGDQAHLERIHAMFSYRDKSAEYQLLRFQKRMEYWINQGIWRHRGFDSKDTFDEWRTAKEAQLKSKLEVFCCEKVADHLKVPVGLYETLIGDFKAQHLSFTTTDHRNFDLNKKLLSGFCPELRLPQKEALKEMLKAPIGTLRMATGVGKTLVGQEIIRHYGVRSIFLVPSKPILHQTIRRFKAAFGKNLVGSFGDGKKKHKHVTVATYQSVFHSDPDEFDEYELVIADECHHVPADTYYEVVENKLRNAVYRYGLTADEERSDGGTILVEAATGPVVYSYDAPQAIREGYLAEPTFIIYEIHQTEGTYIKWITDDKENRVNDGIIQSQAYTGEDSFPAYKNWILGNDLLTNAVAAIAAQFQKDLSVLILIDEKEHGDKLMLHLKQYGAELVTGDTKNNEEVLARFNARELKLVIATSTLGEGADTVPVDVLINLMGGTKAKQPNGRALRNDPDENGIPRKPKCMIIDFDVPVCPVLHRHAEMREQTHKSCGQVHHRKLI